MSPALFVLSLEPLAQAFRLSNMVSPVCICDTQHQHSLFTDDVMVFLEKSAQCPPHLSAVFVEDDVDDDDDEIIYYLFS